jgi:hypothetical protein
MMAAAAALAASVLALTWIFADGPAGWLYASVHALAIAPGLPLGFVLFGRRHAAGWIAGGLLGYGLTQLVIWAVVVSGEASVGAFLIAWLLLCVLTWASGQLLGPAPLVPMDSWTRADARALLLVLLLVPLLVGPPYRNLGRMDDGGNRYYRAYFTADFVWHSALAFELGKFSLPPRNPYLAPREMNYYWTYFLLPATVSAAGPGVLGDVQANLKVNAFLNALLMVAALFLLVRTAVGSPGPAAWAVGLAVLAASAEGLFAVIDLLRRGRSLAVLADTNIDAITAWEFGGLRIDNIPRSLWYTPQHTTAIALGLIGLLIASAAGAAARIGAVAGAGLALGLATTMNPLIGGICSMIYGSAVLVDAVRTPGGVRHLVKHAIAALPVVLAVAWGAASKVMEGAGSALQFGFTGFSRNSPIVTLLLSIGPLLLPALAGLWPARSRNTRALTIGASGLVLGLLLLYLVRISEASWVGFRAGQILLVSLPLLLAPVLAALRAPSRALLIGVILVVGLPTTLVDTWNAQDIWNRRDGPGFRWTLWITPEQQEAFAWIRANTRPTDIVQMEPMVRAREHWTLIPSFAGRRMAAGLPISLLPLPEYTELSERVRTLFASSDPRMASDIARQMRIDYLYVDEADVAAYPEGTRKFDTSPQYFEPVFRVGPVAVYRVR